MRGLRILLTGGSGTFGRAFIATLLHHGVGHIAAVSRNSEMRYRLEQDYPDPRLAVVPGDVRVLSDLRHVCEAEGPFDLICHAAAEKHITTGQAYRSYVHDVNVKGAQHILEIAEVYHVPRVIALSTDKACEPVNFYGETKAQAERLFIQAGATVVRYGNVLGSSGSVLPLFLQQKASGRITVTDLRMTRFFMPIADRPFCDYGVVQEPAHQPVMSAVGLVQYAIAHGQGGDIFVPTIPSATIANLAHEVGPQCEIVETGIRYGEKLHEKLIADDEVGRTYRLLDGVFCVLPSSAPYMTPVESTFRYTSDVNPQPIRLELATA